VPRLAELDRAVVWQARDQLRRRGRVRGPETHARASRGTVQVDLHGALLAIDVVNLTRPDEPLRVPQAEEGQAPGKEMNALVIDADQALADPAEGVG
jgi:hypothetical protein